uniref:30S ribosomal protein S9, chloroplastic n=1 Tax=Syphacia muris TaxID=451379 RepID=A0A0N5AFS9_9BILA
MVTRYNRRFLSNSTGLGESTPADDYTIVGGDEGGDVNFRLKAAGKAMETYLREGRNYEKMMASERERYELGKRHLANIMGLDAASLTQNDIDRAIEYLFPSALTDKKALPVMKPPEELFPKFEKLEFDEEGRPSDTLFYSLSPKFYCLLSVCCFYFFSIFNKKLATVSRFVKNCSSFYNDFYKFRIFTYAHLIVALNNLASLPLAYEEKDFIFQFRESFTGSIGGVLFDSEIPTVEVDPVTNRRKAKATTKVKRSTAHTVVTDGGTGKYVVNGITLDNFRSLLTREIFYAPLIVTDLLGQMDIVAEIEGPGGSTVIPRAVRHGVALCIAALYPKHQNKLRLAGLLTRDPRRKERNKINQPGARAKWIW